MTCTHKPGTVVWAKMEGFPYWPGRVEKPKARLVTDDDRKLLAAGHAFVRFFGTNDFAVCKHVVAWEEGKGKKHDQGKSVMKRDMDGFKTAVKEAEEFVANPPPEAEEEEEEEEEEGEEEDEDPEEEGDDGEESSADEDGSEEEGEAEAVATGGGGGGADSSDDEGAHKPAAAAADGAAPAADGEAELKAQLKEAAKAEKKKKKKRRRRSSRPSCPAAPTTTRRPRGLGAVVRGGARGGGAR